MSFLGGLAEMDRKGHGGEGGLKMSIL